MVPAPQRRPLGPSNEPSLLLSQRVAPTLLLPLGAVSPAPPALRAATDPDGTDEADAASSVSPLRQRLGNADEDAVLVLRGDGRITYAHGLPMASSALESLAVDDVLHVPARSFWDLVLERFSSHTFITDEPAALTLPTGGHEYVHVSASCVRDASGEGYAIVCRVRSVEPPSLDDAEALEEQRRTELLRLANVGRSHLSLSHELRNPLSVVSWIGESLQTTLSRKDPLRANDRAKLLSQLERLRRSTEHMAKIIASVYGSGRRSVGEVELTTLDDIVAVTLDRYGPYFASVGIDVQVALADDRTQLRCKPHQIVQVLTNLMMNARDALADLPLRWIRIGSTRVGGVVELTVTDSGSASSNRPAREAAGELLRLGDGSRSGGLGLGLQICEDLVARNGGHVFRDKASRNTRYVVVLPVATPEG